MEFVGDRIFPHARTPKYYLCVGIICEPPAENRLNAVIHYRHLVIKRGVFALHQEMERPARTFVAIADMDSLRAPRYVDSRSPRDENATFRHYS